MDGSFASPGRLGLVGMAQERPRPLSMDVVVQAIVSHSPDDLEKLKAAGLAANFCNFFGTKFLQIFGGLVLGCVKTKFCKKICVSQHFSGSTGCAHFSTVPNSKF